MFFFWKNRSIFSSLLDRERKDSVHMCAKKPSMVVENGFYVSMRALWGIFLEKSTSMSFSDISRSFFRLLAAILQQCCQKCIQCVQRNNLRKNNSLRDLIHFFRTLSEVFLAMQQKCFRLRFQNCNIGVKGGTFSE